MELEMEAKADTQLLILNANRLNISLGPYVVQEKGSKSGIPLGLAFGIVSLPSSDTELALQRRMATSTSKSVSD